MSIWKKSKRKSQVVQRYARSQTAIVRRQLSKTDLEGAAYQSEVQLTDAINEWNKCINHNLAYNHALRLPHSVPDVTYLPVTIDNRFFLFRKSVLSNILLNWWIKSPENVIFDRPFRRCVFRPSLCFELQFWMTAIKLINISTVYDTDTSVLNV